MSVPFASAGGTAIRPVIGVLCCNEFAERPIQAVASRFIEPLSKIAGATVLLVPALIDVLDAVAVSDRLDGLLLTGSRSNVAARHYDGIDDDDGLVDDQRDLVALALAETMIERGRPVFGICRGLQELNVLFGGSLSRDLAAFRHHREETGLPYHELFDHRHAVALSDGGLIATETGARTITVNSVHRQGIDRLGSGLTVEATAVDDGLIEAFSARPCGGDVLAVQWHPEWDAERRPEDRAFFDLIGRSLTRTANFGELQCASPSSSP